MKKFSVASSSTDDALKHAIVEANDWLSAYLQVDPEGASCFTCAPILYEDAQYYAAENDWQFSVIEL